MSEYGSNKKTMARAANVRDAKRKLQEAFEDDDCDPYEVHKRFATYKAHLDNRVRPLFTKGGDAPKTTLDPEYPLIKYKVNELLAPRVEQMKALIGRTTILPLEETERLQALVEAEEAEDEDEEQ